MNRRHFTKLAAAGFAGITMTSRAVGASESVKKLSSGTPFKSKFYTNFGHFRASTNGLSLVDKLKFFYDCGFRGIEDNGMGNRPVEEQIAIGKQLEKLGMEMGVFCASLDWDCARMAGNRMGPNISKDKPNPTAVRELIKKRMEEALEIAKRVNAKWCTVVPGLEDPQLEPEYQFANVVENLRYAAEICERTGLIMVLEPLNIKNHPQLYLKRIPQAYAICRAVNSPCCKILDDMYHQQITEGHLIKNFDEARSEIAYVQVGDVPGRKEPTTGEINYKNIFKHLWEVGYRGVIGMEHGQSDKTVEGDKKLIDAYRSVDV